MNALQYSKKNIKKMTTELNATKEQRTAITSNPLCLPFTKGRTPIGFPLLKRGIKGGFGLLGFRESLFHE
jgi:hypothetical protein